MSNTRSEQPKRRPLVAVIGDARVEPGGTKDLLAEEVGRLLVDAGYRVLTGGLGGVMEAACRGARSSSRYQSGDTVAVLPGHDPGEANEFVDVAIASGLDHVRNSIVAHADAVIAIGGGAGTMSEICLAWIYKRLIVALRVEGWSGKIADQRVDERMRYPDEPDDRVFGATSAADAVRTVVDRVGRFTRQHGTIRRRGTR
ncbi:MAG: TIGR00725 family protein [Candidatus Eisenbacteria bacterium]|nr:TIGR00725 family protein [Candidatus Eisenbacteria bacterium]